MKYRIEVSEEQLRVIGLAVDEYMRLRMGQFDALAEELALDGVADRIEAYKDDYQRGILNERGYSIERMFEAAYKMAYPPHGCRGRQHDSWGTCIDIVHAIEHQQWLDSPGEKRESPGTTNRSFKPIPLGHEPFPKIERGGRMSCLSCENYIPLDPPIQRTDSNGQTYEIPGLCKIGADHIISGLPVYLPTAKCDKITEAPLQNGS